jgi:hypothetical protein
LNAPIGSPLHTIDSARVGKELHLHCWSILARIPRAEGRFPASYFFDTTIQGD